MYWYFEVLKRYAAFGGRARRQEYWTFALVNFAICFVVGIVAKTVLGGSVTALLLVNGILLIYALLVLLPGIAVTVRRLHDTGRSGSWCWLALIPVVGWLVLLLFVALEGTPGSNAYGPSPKGA